MRYFFIFIVIAALLSTSRINCGDNQTVLYRALGLDTDFIFKIYLNYFKNCSTKPHTERC